MEARDKLAEGETVAFFGPDQAFDDWAADLASQALKGRPDVQVVDGELQCPTCKNGDSLNFNCDIVEIRGVELHKLKGKHVLGVYYGGGGSLDCEGENDRIFCGTCCIDLDIPDDLEILWDPTDAEQAEFEK
jgi:hypothetical protein